MSIEFFEKAAEVEKGEGIPPSYRRAKNIRRAVFTFLGAGVLVFAVFASYETGARNERSEPKDVSVLVAMADSNIVGLQQIAQADSLRANEAGLNIIYWRGVKDAFLSLDEDEVRVLKQSLRP